MDIYTPLRELGPVDSSALCETILAQEPAAWTEDLYRQEEYDVHRATHSIVMLFAELESWPEIGVKTDLICLPEAAA